jgi:DNA-binding IclR family transcriptional regulator
MARSEGLGSLIRGLEILEIVQHNARMRPQGIADGLRLPLSTVYRYLKTLKATGYLIEVDGHVMPSQKLAEPDNSATHLVRYAAPALRKLSAATQMTSVLTVRVHVAALCLDSVAVHPKHRISYQPGEVRALYAGASALPLLAYAPEPVLREILDGDLRRFTSATPDREGIIRAVERTRRQGYAVSEGYLTPGMAGFGVPVIVGGKCMCAISLIGEMQSLTRQETIVDTLKSFTGQLVEHMPIAVMEEAWSGTND